MPSQIDFSLESSATELAGERFEARVLPRMRNQVTALRKRLAAYLALVRFLAGMNVGVLLHVALLMESLPTELTGVRSRVRVD